MRIRMLLAMCILTVLCIMAPRAVAAAGPLCFPATGYRVGAGPYTHLKPPTLLRVGSAACRVTAELQTDKCSTYTSEI